MEKTLSEYASKLEEVVKQRYIRKLKELQCIDPYLMPAAMFNALPNAPTEQTCFPTIDYGDIYLYLINRPSPYQGVPFKSFKSLDAYKFFICGWVRDIGVQYLTTSSLHLFTAKVSHSMKLSETPLRPWVAVKDDGEIVSGHCNCMAGLDEVCSHIAATLFALEATAKHLASFTCTSKPCVWTKPAGCEQQAPFAQAININFTSPAVKRRCQLEGVESAPHKLKPSKPVPKPTEEEQKEFYQLLLSAPEKPVILSVIPEGMAACSQQVLREPSFPSPLPQLYNPKFELLIPCALAAKCEETMSVISITAEQAVALERATRDQAKSMLWVNYRAGRITASNFKAAACTSVANPSISLIQKICYPQKHHVSNPATRWGCQHERDALKKYREEMMTQHDGFTTTAAGLFVHPSYPHLGATPDACTYCTCHGHGIVEIKCPYCAREHSIEDALSKNFYLHKDDEGNMHLKKDSAHYSQVQAQLLLTERPFCDFVVWTTKSMFVERILLNDVYIEVTLPRVTAFYMKCILPELLCHHYSRMSVVVHKQPENNVKMCLCQGMPCGSMFACASEQCRMKWFHMACFGYKRKPNKQWLCPMCKNTKK